VVRGHAQIVKQIVTTGIILKRINYGEADRIITVVTPDNGKLRLMAKGSRRLKSKLAGGIDFFTVSDLTFMPGKGEMGTLISSRMRTHYGKIVSSLERVQLGYELTKLLDKSTEDNPEAEYFELLQQAYEALEDADNSGKLIRAWFQAQLLRLAGHTPNLQTTIDGGALDAAAAYNLDLDDMSLVKTERGRLKASHIKFLRLVFDGQSPKALSRIVDNEKLLAVAGPLIDMTMRTYA